MPEIDVRLPEVLVRALTKAADNVAGLADRVPGIGTALETAWWHGFWTGALTAAVLVLIAVTRK